MQNANYVKLVQARNLWVELGLLEVYDNGWRDHFSLTLSSELSPVLDRHPESRKLLIVKLREAAADMGWVLHEDLDRIVAYLKDQITECLNDRSTLHDTGDGSSRRVLASAEISSIRDYVRDLGKQFLSWLDLRSSVFAILATLFRVASLVAAWVKSYCLNVRDKTYETVIEADRSDDDPRDDHVQALQKQAEALSARQQRDRVHNMLVSATAADQVHLTAKNADELKQLAPKLTNDFRSDHAKTLILQAKEHPYRTEHDAVYGSVIATVENEDETSVLEEAKILLVSPIPGGRDPTVEQVSRLRREAAGRIDEQHQNASEAPPLRRRDKAHKE